MYLRDVSAYTGTRYFLQAAECQKQKHQRQHGTTQFKTTTGGVINQL